MFIRRLNQQEILSALHLVWEVFATDTAPYYSPEGVAEFQRFIKYEKINEEVQKGNLTFLGAFEHDRMCGVAAVQRSGHIALFFVKKEWQRKGVGRMLFAELYQYCQHVLKVRKITVNAAPGAVEAYRHLGMRDMAPEQLVNGMRFVPMEMPIAPAKGKGTMNRNTKILIGCAVAASILVTLAMLGRAVYHEVSYVMEEEYGHGQGGSGQYEVPQVPGMEQMPYESEEDEEPDGIDAIPAYEAEDAGYEIEDEDYTYQSEETKKTTIQFEVYYPQITGLDESVQASVNEMLKACAMETVDEIYLNPTAEIKEKVLGEEYPVLASFVHYKVSYMSKDFISVVFQDYNYRGSAQDYQVSLRTRNISLKDGKAYEVKDIVELNDAFVEDWIQIMRDEAQNDRLLSELSKKEMKEVLSGDDKEGIYYDNFFVDADGLEIGLNLEYEADDNNNLGFGWVTAPFDREEIEEYETDSGFWEEIEQ